ncbi:MAG: hypothetical protein R2873_14305 [Caldilineaceae bacterium]
MDAETQPTQQPSEEEIAGASTAPPGEDEHQHRDQKGRARGVDFGDHRL